MAAHPGPPSRSSRRDSTALPSRQPAAVRADQGVRRSARQRASPGICTHPLEISAAQPTSGRPRRRHRSGRGRVSIRIAQRGGQAHSLGRPIGAVPGPVTSAASAGCHRLLQEGIATIVTDARDATDLLDSTNTTEPGSLRRLLLISGSPSPPRTRHQPLMEHSRSVTSEHSKPITSHGDELTNLGLGLLLAGAGLAVILRVAGSVAAWMTGIPQPVAGIAAGLAVVLDPSDPAAALHPPGLNPVAYWGCVAMLILVAGSGIVLGWRSCVDPSKVDSRPVPDPWNRGKSGRRESGLRVRADEPRSALATIADEREAHGRRLPDRTLPLGRGLGQCRGLDPGHRPTTVGQGRAHRDQRDPRCSRSRGHDIHPPRQPHRNAPGSIADRPHRRLRPTAARRWVPAGLRWSPIRGCENP